MAKAPGANEEMLRKSITARGVLDRPSWWPEGLGFNPFLDPTDSGSGAGKLGRRPKGRNDPAWWATQFPDGYPNHGPTETPDSWAMYQARRGLDIYGHPLQFNSAKARYRR